MLKIKANQNEQLSYEYSYGVMYLSVPKTVFKIFGFKYLYSLNKAKDSHFLTTINSVSFLSEQTQQETLEFKWTIQMKTFSFNTPLGLGKIDWML